VDPVYFPQTEMIGDIANSVWQLNQRLDPRPSWDFEYFMKVRDAMNANEVKGSTDDRFPLYPQRLVADARKVMDEDDIIALDNGIYKIWFARNYRATLPNTVLLDNALASMGAGLPSAIAAKLVYPNKRVMAVCGDGGFMMNSQELETAVRLELDLVVLILNDSGYGMVKWKQSNMGFEDFGLDFNNPDFIQYAGSYGAMGHRPTRADQLIPMMQACLDKGGVHLIDVPVDYSENDEILNHILPKLSEQI
jgi:acetolactate synthase-1/2/3 large subunit